LSTNRDFVTGNMIMRGGRKLPSPLVLRLVAEAHEGEGEDQPEEEDEEEKEKALIFSAVPLSSRS
jgi:hypothetical protein